MKRAVKPLVLSTILILAFNSLTAQIRKLVSPSAFALDIRKVVTDYPNGFANLAGELVEETTQSVQYKCNFVVSGAEQASITTYSSTSKRVASWEALMLTTESFEEGKKKFRSLYTQLNNLSIQISNAGFTLKGSYEAPREELKFTSSTFSLHPDDEAINSLSVELVLEYELTEWKVKVLVYDREREDDERGPRSDSD